MARDRRETRWHFRRLQSRRHHGLLTTVQYCTLSTYTTPADLPDVSPQSISDYTHRLHTSSVARERTTTPGPPPSFAHSKPQSHYSHYDCPCMRWKAGMRVRQTAPGESASCSSSPINRDDVCSEFFSYRSLASPPPRETLIFPPSSAQDVPLSPPTEQAY